MSNRVERAVLGLTRLEGKRKQLQDTVMADKKTVSETIVKRDLALNDLEIKTKALEVFKRLTTILSEKGKKSLENLISNGLSLVFTDRKYSVEVNISDAKDLKKVDFFLIEEVEGERIVSNIRDSVGGSVNSVVSIICQIFFITLTGAERVLFLDESLSDVHVSYREGLFELLERFVDEAGFKILIITHDPDIVRRADKGYVVENGVYREEKGVRNAS